MRNKGLRHYRTKSNPLEARYAKEWERENNPRFAHHGVLDHILAENVNEPMGEVTDRDRVVAATVIQWLGTPVGQAFVARVLGISEYQG